MCRRKNGHEYFLLNAAALLLHSHQKSGEADEAKGNNEEWESYKLHKILKKRSTEKRANFKKSSGAVHTGACVCV